MTDENLKIDCDSNCPRAFPQWHCCRNCHRSRREFMETAPDAVRPLWTDQHGFWDPQHGCRLAREQRPAECRDYDCANQVFLIASARWEGRWPQILRELDRSTATEAEWLAKAKELWAEMHTRALLADHPPETSWEQAKKFSDGPTLYVLHGLMGSGKSGWAKKFLLIHPRARIVSADSFRQMLHGKYEYHAEMDDVITQAMCASITELLKAGYDPVVDCGNLTKERRRPWVTAAIQGQVKRCVAICLPQQHKDWHVMRRGMNPHWQVDWGKIYDGELAALESIDKEAEGFNAVIQISPREVSGKKILILSASPVRDKHIDNLIAGKLRALGHEVKVGPCLREGRQLVLEYKPDIVLVPPIRNPNSRDFVAELKRFGCAVVTRHTEPSCSWQDWKKMDARNKQEIIGAFEYDLDLELVWSADEADILNRRLNAPKAVPVGAIGLDIYFDEKLKRELTNRPVFCKKYNFDPNKPTLLISSPWGFADSSPDLHTDDMSAAKRDEAGRDKHLAMVKAVHVRLKHVWNILLTIHAGLDPTPYAAVAAELKIPLEVESPMLDMLPNCSALIHAGSTAAVSAHLLGIPAFQYGDVNAEGLTNWWGVGESPISRVSPRFETVEALVDAIVAHQGLSNANLDTIKELQEGRYGLIDGKATERAVAYIDRLNGHFRYSWPRSPHDYRQLTIQRTEREFFNKTRCNICGEVFCVLTDEYVKQMATALSVDVEKLRPKMGYCCPHCAARMITN